MKKLLSYDKIGISDSYWGDIELCPDGELLINKLKDVEHKKSLSDEKKECEHDWVSFVDRVDKSKDVWCCKCGKNHEGVYNHNI